MRRYAATEHTAHARVGAIPIPGAKNLEQLRDHLGALDCNLDENEVAVIDERLDAAK